MKKIFRFSKAFVPCVVFSFALIAAGVVSLLVRGINFGIDFKPGLIKEVRISSGTSVEAVASALKDFAGVQVKEVGGSNFQVRVADSGEEGASERLSSGIESALEGAFGGGKVEFLKTDYIGAGFSGSLVRSSILLVLATLALIWLYATLRFHWDFALGAVIAVIHDALIMVAFISWTQMEFSTVTLSAILTIVGYSINDTVVVLDRVRANMKVVNVQKFTDLLDVSLSETLGRSLITTITTLLAVISLFVFTTGSMKDFALALIVGMISGVYSTIYISSAFIASMRRNWAPSDEVKAVPKVSLEPQV